MKLSNAGFMALITLEGEFQAKIYDNDGGKHKNATIGFGHKLHSGPIKTHEEGMVITYTQGLIYLQEDIHTAENVVKRMINIEINQAQFDALVIHAFNKGSGGFHGGDVRKEINDGVFSTADIVFACTNRESGGMLNRRTRESQIFLYGAYGIVPWQFIETIYSNPSMER